MTYTEAALEILRRTGKPLHFKDIATEAVNAGLLSHVGQTPEETMGTRLLAMARREHERKIVTLDTGVFALAEWGLPVPTVVEAPVIVPVVDETAPQYRPRERHPPMQAEVLVGGRRDDRRRSRDEDDGARKKRYGPPADLAYAWLKERGTPATLAEIAAALRENDRIAEALERDLQSFERALKEENRRRQDGRRPPIFEFIEGGTIRALELPKEQPRPERGPKPERPRREEPVRTVTGIDEQRRNVMRSVRRRLGSLDSAALERVCVALLESQGYRELNMARRSAKEGPLYLARRKWGAGEIRYVIRVLRPGRELGRIEVQDIRRDLSHYSGQIGVVFGTGECSRESKSESNSPNQTPVMVYGGEALAEAMVDAGLGATKRLVEWVDYDDEFFASMGAGEVLPDVEGVEPPAIDGAAPEAAAPAPAAAGESDGQRGRERRRPPRRRDGSPRPQQQGGAQGGEGSSEAAPSEASAEAPSEASGESVNESAPAPSESPAEPASAPVEAPAPTDAPAPTEAAPAERSPADTGSAE